MSARRFAVLIGVSDYRAYDQSAQNPRGTSDLFGPAHNLTAMWDFCFSLGYSAADIALLSSPLAPPRGGHPALYAAATSDSVLAAVRTMADELAAADDSQGLIWFSGHGGDVEGVGPVLCVEDTVANGGRLQNVVSLAAIAAILEERAPGKSVTFVLDSCASGLPLGARPGPLGRLRSVAHLRDGDVLISATEPGKAGAEILVEGVWRGALTWALCTAVAPYVRRPAGPFVVPDLSVHRWVERARMLLRGVSVSQHPQLHGEGDAIVLQPSGVPAIRPTNRLADQRHGGIEIDADESGSLTGDEPVWMQFGIRDASNNGIGHLVESYATSSTNLTAYSDFWSWSGSAWPDTFHLVAETIGTVGVNPVPNLSGPVHMMAFPPGLVHTSFGGVLVDGWSVWEIRPTQTSSSVLGWLLRDSSGNLRWAVSEYGYTQSGTLLSNLPHTGGGGGVMLKATTLWFVRMTSPPTSLSPAKGAYDVYQAWVG